MSIGEGIGKGLASIGVCGFGGYALHAAPDAAVIIGLVVVIALVAIWDGL